MNPVTRREFLRGAALLAAGTAAAACVQPAATPAPSAPAAPSGPAAPPTVPTAPSAPEAPTAARYAEAPMLAEQVAAGTLPPVEERLPENPYVATGLDGVGNYGGTWRLLKRGQADGTARSQVIQRSLLKINQDLVQHPLVAESYEASPDGTVWTFHLRKGLKWSDGAPMTAEDFRFWYEDLILNRDYTTAHPLYLGSMMEGELVPAQFAAPDDFTIQYTFAAPAALFNLQGPVVNDLGLAAPSHFLKPFHPAHGDQAEIDALLAASDTWDDWTQLLGDKNDANLTPERPGHHPWVNQNVFSDELLMMNRNPYFWEVDVEGNQLPYFDKITFLEFSDPQVAVLRNVNGEVDCQARHAGGFPNYTVLKEGEAVGDYTVQMWRATRTHALVFNQTTKDPRLRNLFSQRDFRIAVSLCFDRDAMRELLYDGFGMNTQYVAPPDSPYYHERLANAYLEYDPDRANELLDGLGITERDAEGYRLWNDGSGERVSWTVITIGEPLEDVLVVTDYLRDIGLQMNARGMDRALNIEMHRSNEVEMTYSESMDRNMVPLADTKVWTCHTGIDGKAWVLAYTAWKMDPTNPIAEKPPEGHYIWDIWAAYDEMNQTTDQEAQKQAFFRIMDIWAEEMPCPGLYGGFPMPIPVKNGFKGIHEGYGWDCCSTGYENVIDNATWYWDDPAAHTF
jgi:peptide/nickel transport system substrate-binding protein